MKKLIDIPEEIVKDLKKMAIDADKDLKNFIQDHLVFLVRGQGLNAPYLSTRTKLTKDAQTFGYHRTPAFA
jgi:hypothetical protein